MRFCIDTIEYDGAAMHAVGWAVPEKKGDNVKLYLRKMNGEDFPAEITRIYREDVLRVVYGQEGEEAYGFSITIPGKSFENLHLYMDSETLAVDHTRTLLRFKEAYDAWKRKKR